jgi:predicted alpha/beta-fold hydrolase
MWTVLKSEGVPVYYKRKIFENEDPAYTGTFAVDFVVRPYEGEDISLPPRTTYLTEQEFANIGSSDSKPMLVTLHGLSGGSHELYLRHVLAPLVSDVGGWEACVVNSRGCAKSKITSSVLYNARATWDVRQTVKWLQKQFPNRPLFGIGFSLGANILTNVRIPTSGMIRGAILIGNSTLARKAQNVFLKLPSYFPTHGTSRPVRWHCSGRF